MIRPRLPLTRKWGITLAFGTALISGVSVWVNATALGSVGDAAVYTTLKNLVAAVILIAGAGFMGGVTEARGLSPRSWRRLLVIGVVGGSVPFLLFFSGLAMATAPSAAFIHKTLFIWVALMAVPLLGERIGLAQVAALALLLVGQVMLVAPSATGSIGLGEAMILAATLLWAVEVILAKRLLGDVSPAIVGAGRLGFGVVLLFGYLAVTGKLGVLGTLTTQAAVWVLLTGILLAGYVGTWLAALRRAPATVVTAVLVVGAIVTTALDGLAGGLDLRVGAVLGLIGIGAAALWLSGTAGRVAGATEGQRRLATAAQAAPQDAQPRA